MRNKNQDRRKGMKENPNTFFNHQNSKNAMEENKTVKKIECSKDILESWTERQTKPQKREMSSIKRLSQEPWYLTGKEEREAEKVREGRWVCVTQWWHTSIYEDYSNESLFLHQFEVHGKTDQKMQPLVPASPPLPYTISLSPHPSSERRIRFTPRAHTDTLSSHTYGLY